jgi:hypothetical protein
MSTDAFFSLPRTIKPADWFERVLPGLPLQLPAGSVPAATVYHIAGSGGGTWSVRLTAGKLEVAAGMPWPVAVQTSLTAAHLREVLAGALRDRLGDVLKKHGKPLAIPDLRGLPVDPAKVDAVAKLTGSVALVLHDRELDDSYRFVWTFGSGPAAYDKASCTLEVDADDCKALLIARTPPLQLLASGKFRVAGDTGLPMRALGALLGG